MAKVTGSVDDCGRPVVRMEGKTDSVLMMVDSGFNGDLLLSIEAATGLGVDPQRRESEVELGDGRLAPVLETRTTLPAPAAPAGTDLLTPHLLLIDFGSRIVEIETQS